MLDRPTTTLLGSALFVAVGCADEPDERVDPARVDALAAAVEALSEQVETLSAENAALREELDALTGDVDLTDLAQEVAENAASIESLQASQLTSADLAGYATETWVGDQGYLTGTDLAGYATQSWVESHGYLTGTDLDGLATEAYVDAVTVPGLAGLLRVENNTDVVFDGANIHLRSGVGWTAGTNGLGNLIVGYNEGGMSVVRSGSHNIVIGEFHDYTSHSGLAVGFGHYILGEGSTVVGGYNNTASGDFATVSGGKQNTASTAYQLVP